MEEKRCYGCMQLKTQSPLCEHCGYNENIDNLSHQLPLGTVLQGRYEIGKVLGQGGFGITYLGWDQMLQTPVAIKEFFPNGTVTRESTQSLNVINTTGGAEEGLRRSMDRFMKEAQTLSKLGSVPQIVHVYNLFEENNTAYIVMEYIKGIDLRRYTTMVGGRLSAEQTLAILGPVMQALERVHEAGLVHRDISPDNIMLLPDGSAKLLDFGAVREVLDADVNRNLSRSTEAILKHGFAPMEQYQRQGNLGPWTDVYALCATIFYCMTGEVPADAPNRIMDDVEIPWDQIPGLTEKQIQVLQQGMALKAKDRVASIRELREALIVQKEQVPPPPPPPPPPPKWPKIVAAAAAVVIGAFFLFGGNGGSSEKADGTTGTPKPSVSSPKAEKPNTPANRAEAEAEISSTPGAVHKLQDGSYLELYFDSLNNERLRIFYDADGKELYRFTATYDTEGDMLTHQTYDAAGNLLRSDEYTRNADGKVLECLTYGEDGKLWEKQENTFNSWGKVEASKTWNGSNELKREAVYTYDGNGNIKHKYFESADGSTTEETYTDNGRKSHYVSKDEFGNIEYQTDYVYDEEGRTIQRLTSGSTTEIERDADGNVLKEITYDETGVQESVTEYTYDAYGNQLTYSYIRADYSSTTWYAESIHGFTIRSNSDNGDIIGISYYNALGQIQQRLEYDNNGRQTGTDVYRYDTEGVLLGHTSEYLHSNGSRSEYEYDADYNMLSSVTYDASGAVESTRKPVYNDRGQMTEETTYRADGSISHKNTYSYDENGIRIGDGYTSYREDGTKSSDSTYTYDAYGNCLGGESTYYSTDGSYSVSVMDGNYRTQTYTRYSASGKVEDFTRYEYELDDRGNEIKEIQYDSDGKIKSIQETTYDANNKRTGSKSTSYNDDGSYYVYTYNEHYDTTRSERYDANGNRKELTTYENEYDADGNQIKQTAYDENGKRKYWVEYTYDENGNYVDSEWHYD